MSSLYDYNICVKRLKLSDVPSDLSLQIECGADSHYATPSLIPSGNTNYVLQEEQQHFVCRQCKENESIIFTCKYDVQENGNGITLEGSIPFTKLTNHAVMIDKWITLFHKKTESIAGAILLSLVPSLSDSTLQHVRLTDSTQSPFFPDCYPYQRSKASVDSQPTISKLGYYNGYYM
ncbi:hypothetical protein WA556_006656 [Blastocystis sp. ATCC 50177/Nand II]